MIPRQMPFYWRINRSENVVRTTLRRKKYLDAHACGLDRLDEYELVLVGNDRRCSQTAVAHPVHHTRLFIGAAARHIDGRQCGK